MRGDGTMRFAAWTCPAGELEVENREVEEVQMDGTWIGQVAKLLALVTFSSDGVLLPLSYVMYFDQDESTYNAALSSIRGLLRVRQLRVCQSDGELDLIGAMRAVFQSVLFQCKNPGLAASSRSHPAHAALFEGPE
jgi:hypothetical protein